MPRIEPGAAGREASMLSTVLCGPRHVLYRCATSAVSTWVTYFYFNFKDSCAAMVKALLWTKHKWKSLRYQARSWLDLSLKNINLAFNELLPVLSLASLFRTLKLCCDCRTLYQSAKAVPKFESHNTLPTHPPHHTYGGRCTWAVSTA